MTASSRFCAPHTRREMSRQTEDSGLDSHFPVHLVTIYHFSRIKPFTRTAPVCWRFIENLLFTGRVMGWGSLSSDFSYWYFYVVNLLLYFTSCFKTFYPSICPSVCLSLSFIHSYSIYIFIHFFLFFFFFLLKPNFGLSGCFSACLSAHLYIIMIYLFFLPRNH